MIRIEGLMITYLKSPDGKLKEILDFECKEVDVSKVSPGDGKNFRQDLLTLTKMPSPSAQNNYTYVAIANTKGGVRIYYVRKDLIERVAEEKDIGLGMSYFNGGLLEPEKIAEFIESQIRRTWIDLAETAIKELYYRV